MITGENYESGAGIRRGVLPGMDIGVHVNIFNISKINSEVRGGKSPRIKRLSEYIGESYFEYLAGLDDLHAGARFKTNRAGGATDIFPVEGLAVLEFEHVGRSRRRPAQKASRETEFNVGLHNCVS